LTSISITTSCYIRPLATVPSYTAQRSSKLAYKRAATRPAAPIRPGKAVAIAPEPEDEALEAELAAELRLFETELALLEAALEAELKLLETLEADSEAADEATEEAEEEAEEAEDEAEPVILLRTEPVVLLVIDGMI
jgi:Skp family chaperone for outer membrane proteins